MKSDYLTILGFCVVGLSFFLSIFYLLRSGLKDDGYKFLYLILLLLSYELFYKTLIHSEFIYSFPWLYLSKRFFNLLVYPFFLFFVLSVTKPEFKLRIQHWGLILSMIILLIINYYPTLSLQVSEKLTHLDQFYADSRPGAYNYWKNWKTLLLGTILPLFFTLWVAYEFMQFKKTKGRSTQKTLLKILLCTLLLFLWFHIFSDLIYRFFESLTGYSMIEWPVDISFLSLVILLFASIALLVNGGAHFLPPSKYASSALSQSDYQEIVSRISQIIEEQELYKQKDFNLQRLAKIVDLNPSYCSQAINHHLNMRFNDFVNGFRVDESKRQLLDHSNQHLTIEAIAERCGFQSKSTFFRVFKKATGFTPKQFIQLNSGAN